jgi:predicted nucleic acid-binding Zn ribbon protein
MSRKTRDLGKIPPHKHCIWCGKAVDEDKRFCSNKCEEEFNKAERRRKRSFIIYMILLMAMFLVWFLLISGRGRVQLLF